MPLAQRIRAAGGILAKGDAHIAGLNTRISELVTSNAGLTTENTDLKSRLEAAEAKVTKLETEAKDVADAMAAVELEAKQLREQEKDLSKRAVAKAKEKLGELGFQSSKLPAASDKISAEDHLADLKAQFKAEADPVKKGKLAKQLREAEAKAKAAQN